MSAPAASSRLWGVWDCAFFGSGTTIVQLKGGAFKPHLYVIADAAVDERRYMRDRYAMCDQLRDFLNGGSRPTWLDDFFRASPISLESLAGAKLFATGPSIDADPPKCFWVQDESPRARLDRESLINAIWETK